MRNSGATIFTVKAALLLVILTGPLAHGQQAQIDSLKKDFRNYREQNPIEKVFVHLDRTSYLTGETMWCKIYCVNGTTHQPMDLSRAAYIEVIDRGGQSVLQAKVELVNGSGNGSLFIPATLRSDNYVVRAYTQWMRNNPSEYFFQQPISIINTFRAPEGVKQTSASSIDAQFMPEGGSLVAGIPSKVGFRVTDSHGVGVDFKGALIDSKNDTVLHFAPSRYGIGTFSFTPQNDRYTAVIKTSSLSKVEFPTVEQTGYALSVSQTSDKFQISVQTTVSDSQPFVYAFVHSRNQIAVAELIFLKNGHTQLTIDKNKLSEGVSHITIFTSDLQPVCERLVYLKPSQVLSIKAKTDAADYSPRRKVKLSLSINGSSGESDLSVSVFKTDSLKRFSQQSIASYLLLSSDLNGTIDDPDFYLNEGTDEDFDNLMLTHGWRKFNWETILAGKNPITFIPESQGATLTGKLYDETGKPAANIQTYLSSPSKIARLVTSISGPEGELRYNVKDFEGKRKLILQTNFSRDSLYEFRIDNPFVSAPNVKMPDLILKSGIQNTLLSRSISMQVQDVYNGDQYFKSTEALADSTPFYGKPDEHYRLDDYTRFPVMEEVMREYVPGVWVRKRQGEFYFMVIDNINKSVFKEDPLILVDGVPVFNANDIMTFSPLKIKQLDVVDRLFFLGRSTFSGIVSYSTYTGDLSGFRIHPKSIVLDYEGLQMHRTFYSPVYESERQRSNRLPDQRTLLQWSPNVKAISGEAEIEFYTSDISGTFEINVQGLDKRGHMGSAQSSFSVNGYENQ